MLSLALIMRGFLIIKLRKKYATGRQVGDNTKPGNEEAFLLVYQLSNIYYVLSRLEETIYCNGHMLLS